MTADPTPAHLSFSGWVKALRSLDPEGVMRPLLEALLRTLETLSAQTLSPEAAGKLASLVRSLATAERLPTLDWGGVCRQLLASNEV